jgi:hypothetical protein
MTLTSTRPLDEPGIKMPPKGITESRLHQLRKCFQLQQNFVISLPPFRAPSEQTFNFPAQAPRTYTLPPLPTTWLAYYAPGTFSVALLVADAGGLFRPEGCLSSFGGGDFNPEGTLSSFGGGDFNPEGTLSSLGAGLLTPEGNLSSFGIEADFAPDGVRSSFGGAGELMSLGFRSSFGIGFFVSELVLCVDGLASLSVGVLAAVVGAAERPNIGRDGMLVGIDGRYDVRVASDWASGFCVLVALPAALLTSGALSVLWWIMGGFFRVFVADFAASEVFFPAFVACLLTESVTAFSVSVAFLSASVGAVAGLPRLVILGILGKLGR